MRPQRFIQAQRLFDLSHVVSGAARIISLCRRISGNISEGKVIKGTTLQSLTSFIDRFKEMNFVGDTTVEESLESLRREILDAHPSQEFKDNAELKVELKRRLDMVAEQASALSDISQVTGQYRRKIDWQ